LNRDRFCARAEELDCGFDRAAALFLLVARVAFLFGPPLLGAGSRRTSAQVSMVNVSLPRNPRKILPI
jgi:hypothetical protein